tara:strand:+ start:262 stop:471 length:210 start_codon:yes stop_codon:yes gene_type:complete
LKGNEMKRNSFFVGDVVEHVSGSQGTVIDTVRELDATRFQYLVTWHDDDRSENESWELRQDLNKVPLFI